MNQPKLLFMFICSLIAAVNSTFAQTWTQTSAPIANWQTLASSSDGSKLVAAVYNGGIYISTNSGATWALTTAPSTNWTSIAVSFDGNKIIATSYSGGDLYLNQFRS
jgi:hypothetical protein